MEELQWPRQRVIDTDNVVNWPTGKTNGEILLLLLLSFRIITSVSATNLLPCRTHKLQGLLVTSKLKQ